MFCIKVWNFFVCVTYFAFMMEAWSGVVVWRTWVAHDAGLTLRRGSSIRCCLTTFDTFIAPPASGATAHASWPFLPRDAMRKCSLCCRPMSVRPSVCPSITLVYRITAEDIVILLSWPGNLIILVFDPKRRYPITRGTPSAWAQNTLGYGENLRFSTKVCLSRKRYEIGPLLLWNVNRKWRHWIDPCRFRWPWMTRNPGFKIKS